MTGAVLSVFLGASAMAQTAGEDMVPVPQNRPSVENYSLPPGPDSAPKKPVLQGPVDADIPPVGEPTNVAPRTNPAKAPAPLRTPETSSPAAKPATMERTADRAQQKVKKAQQRPESAAEIPIPKTALGPVGPAVASDERQESSARSADTNSPPTKTPAVPVPETATNDWQLLLFGLLLFVLLGALFLWRARTAAPKQSAVTMADPVPSSLTSDFANLPEPVEPVPAISIGFHPRSANTTLFNAVVAFELTLSNHGGDVLKDIRVNGAMVQAEDHRNHNPILADLTPLRTVVSLPTGETEKIVAEFRIPLAGIHPILFRSQALFVPLVQISIEFTDGSGFQHFQTSAFLVGQEHQPPRSKMAPFRLDLGPRSFAPLGHRPFAVN